MVRTSEVRICVRAKWMEILKQKMQSQWKNLTSCLALAGPRLVQREISGESNWVEASKNIRKPKQINDPIL